MQETTRYDCHCYGTLCSDHDVVGIRNKVSKTSFLPEEPIKKGCGRIALSLLTSSREELESSVKSFQDIVRDHGIKRARIEVNVRYDILNE